MPHTHEFDCKSCGAHLDSRQELDQHNRKYHPDGSARKQEDAPRQSSSSDRRAERS